MSFAPSEDCARSIGAVVVLAMFVPYKLDVAFIAFVTTAGE